MEAVTVLMHEDRRAHWDCWGSHGEMEHIKKAVPNSTSEAAMDELLAKARFVFGDKPWHEGEGALMRLG